MIANGGKLVTPHIAEDVEQTGERRPAAARPAPLRRAAAAADRRRPDRAARTSSTGSRRRRTRRSARRPACSATSRSTSPARRARPRSSITLPGYPNAAQAEPVVVVRLRPVRRADDRRLRRDRERRPRRHRGRARRAEGVRAVLPHDRHDDHDHAVRLMAIEAVDPRARGLRPRREVAGGRRSPACSAGSTGCCCGALVAVVGYGLWAIDGITRARRRAARRSTRQALYAVAGALLFVVVLFVDPDRYRRLLAADLLRDARA